MRPPPPEPLAARGGSSERAHTALPFAGDVRRSQRLRLRVTIRVFARIAGLAVVAAEATAVATRVQESPTPVFGTVFVALQIVAVGWATDRRSTVVLRMVAPALLTAVA